MKTIIRITFFFLFLGVGIDTFSLNDRDSWWSRVKNFSIPEADNNYQTAGQIRIRLEVERKQSKAISELMKQAAQESWSKEKLNDLIKATQKRYSAEAEMKIHNFIHSWTGHPYALSATVMGGIIFLGMGYGAYRLYKWFNSSPIKK